MKKPSGFLGYELSFFSLWTTGSPQHIISQGNNKEILGACILPKTKQQLEQLGVTVADNQIELLKKWRLLKVQNGTFQTAIVILSKSKAFKLREYTKLITPRVVQTIGQDFDKFSQALGGQYASSAYIIFFSYILDSLAWDRFAERGLIHVSNKDKKEFWTGVIWGNYLPRPFFLGTNTYDIKNISYKVIWNNNLLPKVKPLFYHPEIIPLLVKGLPVPVIHEQSGNLIYERCLRLSMKLAEEVLTVLSLPALVKEYGLIDEEQALVIVYHELMWDMLEEMESKGMFAKPAIVANPKQASGADVVNLICLIER